MEYKFQDKLISLRKEKGIPQEFLADKLHVSRQTISKRLPIFFMIFGGCFLSCLAWSFGQ